MSTTSAITVTNAMTMSITITTNLKMTLTMTLRQMQAADRMEEWRAEQTRLASMAASTTPSQPL